jgi:hypothetical protein
MALTAQERLAKLNAAFDKKVGATNSNTNWKLFYPFWKMQENQTAVVRFLPDVDEDNPMMFLVENLTHELHINGEKKTVPCLGMYDEGCPICDLSRKYYDEKNEPLGKKYYRKRDYIGQVIIIESPIDHDQAKLVKLISFGPKIFQRIQAAFKSGDLELPPFELKGGYNFRLNKTKAGQWADYSTSSFAPRATDIEDAVIAQLELYDLKNYREAKVERGVVEAMLLADQTGAPVSQATPAAPAAAYVPPPVVTPVSTPIAHSESIASAPVSTPQAAAPAGDAPKVDILAQLRERAAARKAAEAAGA